MCFSASASFVASAFLIAISVATLSKAKNSNQKAFAAIPLLFGLQQFFEGIVWISFTYPALATARAAASYIFLSFAFIVWPLYIPFSIYLLEQNQFRKKKFRMPFAAGFLVASAFIMSTFYTNLTTAISCNHIFYTFSISEFWYFISSPMYLIATIAPFFISTYKRMWVLGCVLAISYAISYFFYFHVLTSVWCFFGAVLSTLIFLLLN